jgi:uncharacterized repeat protein (TIGR01451 family)
MTVSLVGLRRVFEVALLLFLLVALAPAAHAQLSFELRTGNNTLSTQQMTVDSNKCPSEGPTAAYVGGLVRNNGAAPATDVNVSLTGLNANVYLAGGQPASQFIGTLDAGQSIAVFWFTGFGCTSGATATPTISMTSSAGTQTRALTLRIQTAISAAAGGNVIGSALGPGAVVGQTIYFDANYDFGGTGAGDEYWLQPSGAQNFNAACFRLTGSIITGSNLNAAPIGTTNLLKLVQPNSQPGNNYNISVRYYFEYLCAGSSTIARPYAVQTSGTKIKYTGNYDGTGSVAISFPGASNPFTITKTVSEAVAFVGAGGNLTYTITISNPSAHPAILGQITDVLPSGMTFVALASDSQVTAANSSATPSAGATGTLNFIGRRGQSYALAAGGSVALKYTATRPPGTGTFVNSARGVFGAATTATATADYEQVAVQPLSVSKVSTVFSDPINGTASAYAIPGALIEYAVTIGNPNPLPVDADSVTVVDDAPSNAKLCLASLGATGPIEFTDGSTPSTMTFTFADLGSSADDLDFSNDDRSSWTYTPTADGDGCDTDISDFRIRPNGSFAPNSSFTLRYRMAVD